MRMTFLNSYKLKFPPCQRTKVRVMRNMMRTNQIKNIPKDSHLPMFVPQH